MLEVGSLVVGLGQVWESDTSVKVNNDTRLNTESPVQRELQSMLLFLVK